MSSGEELESQPKLVGDWENDPEWSEYELALILAWIDYLEEKGIDIYLNRCNSEYTSH